MTARPNELLEARDSFSSPSYHITSHLLSSIHWVLLLLLLLFVPFFGVSVLVNHICKVPESQLSPFAQNTKFHLNLFLSFFSNFFFTIFCPRHRTHFSHSRSLFSWEANLQGHGSIRHGSIFRSCSYPFYFGELLMGNTRKFHT